TRADSNPLSFFLQAADGTRDRNVTGAQTCALPISEIDVEGTATPGTTIQLMNNEEEIDETTVDDDGQFVGTATLEQGENELTAEIGRASCRERGSSTEGGGQGRTSRRVTRSTQSSW